MENILDKIKTQCEWLANNNEHVKIRLDNIANYAKNVTAPPAYWDEAWHYIGDDEDTLAYIIALDSINFGSGYFDQLKKREGENSGYATIAMGLKDKFLEKPMTASDFANLTAKDCSMIFAQDMPELMSKFALALNETGKHIVKHYNGSFTQFVKTAKKSAPKLVEQLAKIPHFQDISTFQGREIPIYKRAQITVGDIHTAFKGLGIGEFHDISELTIFADNVVPHVLRYDGILEYSDELANKIDNGIALEPESEEEIALRACSIHAVEKIIAELASTDLISMNIDHWLWHKGHEGFYMGKKRHNTKTIRY